MEVDLAYAQRTNVLTTLNGSALELAANLRRLPVAFRGAVKDPLTMRQLMIALHDVIMSDYRSNESWWLLDPVITVHPDEIFFEAFSTDESAYARLSAPLEAFDVAGEPTFGTTNIDFTFGLRDAVQRLRSSRRTTFEVGAAGFGVTTEAGVAPEVHFERKVDLPESWVRGFLQVQGALTMRPFTFEARPVDLISIIHYIMDNNARRPPRGMRYTFAPGEPVRVVLEPWNESFTLKGTEYDGYERVVRVWGRKRLELLLNVLPYAQRVTVGVLGRGMPHFYVCHCGDYAFTLVLSGWTRGAWSGGMAFDLLAPPSKADPEAVATVYNHLVQYLSASRSHTAEHTGLGFDEVEAALLRLCKAGRAIYDPVSHRYRSRELFREPLDVDALFAPDPRVAEAEGLVESGAVRVDRVFPSDTRKNEIKALAEVAADGTTYDVLVAVDRDGRIRFAQCQCAFFQDNILSRGPCAHILAARFAAEDRLQEVEKSLIMEGR